jgi:hypothetical protein
MTRLESGRPVRRETAVCYKGRPLLIELYPGHLTLREKGRRFRLDVDYRTVLDLAFKMLHKAAAAERAAKKSSRSGKR